MNPDICNRISELPDAFVENAEISPRQQPRFDFDQFESNRSAGFEHILVATDFSEPATKAVQLGAGLASRCRASVTLLHVVDTNPVSASAHAGTADVLMDQSWQRAVNQMLRLKTHLLEQNIQAETLILEGLPWEQIVMQSRGFDLLVLGRSHPRHSRKFFAKHTARRVMKGVVCPVLSA
jgi:nucleotide-binding universal stress UspA family protein